MTGIEFILLLSALFISTSSTSVLYFLYNLLDYSHR